MEWIDMRESFCPLPLLGLTSIRRKAQNSSANGSSTVSAEPVTFLEPQDARLRLRHPTWTDRLGESLEAILIDFLIKDTRSHPRYVTMYERSVQQKRFVCLVSFPSKLGV
jgi:hypothetical protein